MNIALIFGLLKVAIETFQDERKGRYLKKWNKLNKELMDEKAKSDNEVSDLAIDNIMLELELLSTLVLSDIGK